MKLRVPCLVAAVAGFAAAVREELPERDTSDDESKWVRYQCPGVDIDQAPLVDGHHVEHARPEGYPRVLEGSGNVTKCWEDASCHSCCGGTAFGCPKLKGGDDAIMSLLQQRKWKGGDIKHLHPRRKQSLIKDHWLSVTLHGWHRLHGKPFPAIVKYKSADGKPFLGLRNLWHVVALRGWGGWAELQHWHRSECVAYEERPVVVLPASWLLKGFSTGRWSNVGHWLAEVFAPVHEALRKIGKTSGLLLLLRRISLRLRTQDASWENKWPYLAGDLGIPWMAHLAPPAPLRDGLCYRQVVVACPIKACPSAAYVHRRMPAVRLYLSSRYGLSFSPRAPPPRPSVILCTRRIGGSRYIDNARQLAEAARAEWEPTVVPHFGGMSMSQWLPMLQNGDVFASLHGADLILPIALLRRGAVVIEIVPLASSRRDPWYPWMAVGSGVHALRWVVPSTTLRFDADRSQVEDSNEWTRIVKEDSKWAAAAASENLTAVYSKLQWRRLSSNATLSVPEWLQVLERARRMLQSKGS